MVKTLRDKSMVEKRGRANMPDPPPRKARVIRSRLDCLNLRLQRWNVTSTATACMGGAGGIGR